MGGGGGGWFEWTGCHENVTATLNVHQFARPKINNTNIVLILTAVHADICIQFVHNTKKCNHQYSNTHNNLYNY